MCHYPLWACCLLEARELQHALTCKTSHYPKSMSEKGMSQVTLICSVISRRNIIFWKRGAENCLQQNLHWVQMEVLWMKHLTCRGAEPRAPGAGKDQQPGTCALLWLLKWKRDTEPTKRFIVLGNSHPWNVSNGPRTRSRKTVWK